MSNPVILIVDDDPIIRKLLKRVLTKRIPQSTIYEAADGLEASEQLKEARPSLILLDMHLPGMDGDQICAQVRQDPVLKDINILMVTGDGTEDMRNLAFKAGADAFLIKPFTDDLLFKIISQFLRKQTV